MTEHSGQDFMDENALDTIEDEDVVTVHDPQDLSDDDDEAETDSDLKSSTSTGSDS